MQAKRVADRLADRKMKLELADSAVDRLASIGFDPVYGARPVKRAVQRELETSLAKAILRGDFQEVRCPARLLHAILDELDVCSCVCDRQAASPSCCLCMLYIVPRHSAQSAKRGQS